ncbi:MAG: 1-deoxy-D-xylulose-5-phosphate synthase [Nitrospirae bacterium]|nr:MAG: 1-deoxy-D-xylulose-5-phosphate synthase [Nitrospirota bacterium]
MLLEHIESLKDLKRLSIKDLRELASELRDIIIERVSINGGHLASNLGVVELTIALHYVFNSPKDKIIWDVGHQSYAHKLLTGRAKEFHTLRRYNGISGFPKISENIHDAFGTGHSSTSISAALGIREGYLHRGNKNKVVAVIGDGAMTSGLAFEGLNHAGHLKRDLIIVLNDNEMSISKNVGALSAYLSRIITGELFSKFKKESKEIFEYLPTLGEPMLKMAKKMEEMIKYLFVPGMLFEELGFEYIGPVDGHSISTLIETLDRVKNNSGPVLIHVITKKGKGYKPAEENPELFHGTGPFDIESGKQISSSGRTYSEVFGSELVKIAKEDERVVAITAAMCDGTGLNAFKKAFPHRFYDVGIAEPHAVTFAAGLATTGIKPVVAIYSTFLQRAYDQILHDVCLQQLPVVFAIDRAGIVGEDGPTHQGVFDISYLRHIPNLIVMAPSSGRELRDMLRAALSYESPVAIRYPRGKTTPEFMEEDGGEIHFGKGKVLVEGKDILIIAVGNMVMPAVSAAKILRDAEVSATVIDARFIKPLDEELIIEFAKKIPLILTVEENALKGGFGSSILECLSDADVEGVRIKRVGIPDTFVEHGPQDILRKKYSLTPEGIALNALSMIREISTYGVKNKINV